MILHAVLFKPKAGLDAAAKTRILDALRAAHAGIPHIRRFSVGTRVKTGRAYDAISRDFPFIALFEFDSADSLAAYLSHPAHEALGAEFYMSSDAAEAYDFDIVDMPAALDRLEL